LHSLRDSGGTALSVRDSELVVENPRIAKADGIFSCPEAAASVTALYRLIESGWINPDHQALVCNTPRELKYLDVILS